MKCHIILNDLPFYLIQFFTVHISKIALYYIVIKSDIYLHIIIIETRVKRHIYSDYKDINTGRLSQWFL